ncbi:hypothetical protein JR334_01760 [Clostridia bacterium]|nr:hypothetical protein JR334_01760 [Clostridia bacterium]
MRYIELDSLDIQSRETEFNHMAAQCASFLQDDEEEWATESVVNCLNCKRRRWVFGGFQCMKEDS